MSTESVRQRLEAATPMSYIDSFNGPDAGLFRRAPTDLEAALKVIEAAARYRSIVEEVKYGDQAQEAEAAYAQLSDALDRFDALP